MRLRDLDARFVRNVKSTGHRMMHTDSVDGAQGVLFQCPSCAKGLATGVDYERTVGDRFGRYVVGAHYILVLFGNPRGVEPAPANAGPEGSDGSHPRWTIQSGTSLDDLTLSPSINCDIPSKDGTPSVCKFHGYVKQGEAA